MRVIVLPSGSVGELIGLVAYRHSDPPPHGEYRASCRGGYWPWLVKVCTPTSVYGEGLCRGCGLKVAQWQNDRSCKSGWSPVVKTHIEVHNYLDPGPVFRKMHSKRLATYSTLGFALPSRR
jgi:hypothetical protein